MIFIKQFFTAMMIFILASTQPASADIKDHLGPLFDVAMVGVDGEWETKLEGGWFNMINHNDPDGVKYFSMTGPGAENSEWVVDVNVVLRGGGGDLANAGMILNRASNEDFFAFTIGADGTANFITISGDDFKKTDSDKVRAKLDGTDILTVRQTDLSLKLYLNGEEAFTVDGHDGLKFKPTFGIIALGKGRFAYNGFNIKTISGADGFPSPAKPDAQPFPTPAAGGGNPAPEPDPFNGASAEEILAVKVLLGTTFGIFFHEFAHALIGETNLPATGPEEDTADGFSALLLSESVVDGGMSPQEADFMEGVAEYASLYWYYSGVKNEHAGQKNPWQDEHAPDLNRFRNSFCILYGSASARYEDIANRVNFGDRAKFRCKAEYGKRKDAWETILKTVSRNLGPDSPGDHPANTPGGKILLTIQPSQTEVGKVLAQALQIDGFMQEMVQVLERTFVWPRDLNIVFRDCDQINAWYDPDTATVTMCYGIVEYASALIFEAEGAIAQGGGGNAPPANQSPAAFQFMVGTWAASVPGQFDAKVTYYDNGEYHSELNTADQGYAQTIGTWSADLVGEYQIMISFTPVDWEPKTICDAQGNCQPNNQTSENIQIKVLSDNTVDSSGQVWTRTQ